MGSHLNRAQVWPALVVAMLLAACSGGAPSAAPPASTTGPSAPPALPATTPGATVSGPEATATSRPTPAAPSPSASMPTAADPGTVVLAFEENAQLELVSPAGEHVLVDLVDRSRLYRPVGPKDILLTTHAHPDHYDSTFVDAFTGPKLTIQVGHLSERDVTVTGIAAAHTEGDAFEASGGTDYIFVIDVAGLRIVHFGDLGEERLTAAQMKAIGSVDVAISQLSNPYSDMSAANELGIHQMLQVKPRLLIPTHLLVDTVAVLKATAATWPVTYAPLPLVTISRGDLPAKTTVLFMGDAAAAFAKITGATPTPLR